MKPISGEVVDIGFDWITAVGKSQDAQMAMQDWSASLLCDEHTHGNDTKPWSFAGYQGFKCGAVQAGTRPDSTCVRLSSHQSAKHWRELWLMSEGVSRVDAQITIRTKESATSAINRAYKQARTHSAKIKGGPTVTIIRSTDGSCTVYLGKRTSDSFGRIYLKGEESGLDEFAGTIRFECEFKSDYARQVLVEVNRHQVEFIGIASAVLGFFRNRGVSLQVPSVPLYATHCSRRRSDNQKRLEWLATQVRPSVKLLVDAGLLVQVVNALDLAELLQEAQHVSPSVR